MKGAWNGTRQEADSGADCRIAAADRGGYGERVDGGHSVQGSRDHRTDLLPLAQGVWRLTGGSGAAAEGA
jgi:hypothetical protein